VTPPELVGTAGGAVVLAEVSGINSIGGTNGVPPPAVARSAIATKSAQAQTAMTTIAFPPLLVTSANALSPGRVFGAAVSRS
jgi:hypothetical protein